MPKSNPVRKSYHPYVHHIFQKRLIFVEPMSRLATRCRRIKQSLQILHDCKNISFSMHHPILRAISITADNVPDGNLHFSRASLSKRQL